MTIITRPTPDSHYQNNATAYGTDVKADLDTIYADHNGGLTDANINIGAGIASAKLASITTAGKVSGTSLTGLASIPAGAGTIPSANLALIWSDLPAGSTIQSVVTVDQTARTLSGAEFPQDSSKPQSNEGVEYTQLATTITPKSATNKLIIECVINCSFASGAPGSQAFDAGLFQDSNSDCIALSITRKAYDAGSTGYEASQQSRVASFIYSMTAGTTSATTFKIRVGASTGSAYVNSDNGQTYGNLICSSLKITEVKV